MKKADFICIIAILLFFLPFFLSKNVFEFYWQNNIRYPYLLAFIKFFLLAPFGEMLGLRIKKGVYHEKGFGLLPRAFVWGFLGISLKMAFDAIREAGCKVIVRVSYSDDIGQPDASKDQIFRHIDQLQPLYEQNKDVICLSEAGFIGAWGEWHSSTNGLDTPENRRDILFKLLSALPEDRMAVVRTPHFKRQIFSDSLLTEDRAFDGSNLARTGFHNDCFLSSSTDYGTYIEKPRAEEIAYIGGETRFTPFGGETCDLYSYNLCDHAIEEMEKLHCTYLNDGWYPGVLDRWENDGCMDEIERRLGYRFVLVTTEVSERVRPGGVLVFNFILTNVGFAAPFNPRLVELVLRNNDTQQEDVAQVSVDPRYWLPPDTFRVEKKFRIPMNKTDGTYSLLLRFPDPAATLHDDPRYSIRLANTDTWDESTGSNIITTTFAVDSTASGEVDSDAEKFEEISGTTGFFLDSNVQPVNFKLRAYPNPFNSQTVIEFVLTKQEMVNVSIFNSNGKLVTKLCNGKKSPGTHSLKWNGKSSNGESVSSGVYLIRLKTANRLAHIKLTYLK